MIIKVQCPCGTRFEFEVAPVNGRMPMAIHCPTCNADDTELANVLIQQQAAVSPPPQPSLRISGHKAPVASPPPTAQADSPDPAAEPTAQPCPKHKSEASVEACCVCGKPICLKCMEQFGHVCSAYCRQQATAKRIYIPVYAGQKSVVAGKAHAMAKRLTTAVVVLVVLLLGFWFWYAWFARDPKVVYSLPIPKPDPLSHKAFNRPEEFYQLIGPGQLLSVKGRQIALFDLGEQKQIWSTPLQGEGEAATGKSARDQNVGDDFYFGNPQVIATTNDVWVSYAARLARFDRQTGSRKDVPIKDKILNVTASPDAILVVSGTPGVHETLVKISTTDGTVQTEEILAPPKAEVAVPTKLADKNATKKARPGKPAAMINQVPAELLKAAASQTDNLDAAESDAAFASFGGSQPPFIAAGPNVVELKTRELEHKTVSHVAMKPKGKSVLDSANLNASQGLDVAQEMMNDSRREATGGVEVEDVSRYEVTLHRRLETDVPDWTGEVIGPPRFFTLKTVDVLVAGQGLYVFDKQNKKLWETKLTFSIAPHFSGERAPCVETADALYFADLGILTRYDLTTGNVRWRYNSVGISRIYADERGGLYLATTTAGPEQIQYSQEINIHDKIHPVIEKLAAETGKELWRQESLGDDFIFSGKFLYVTKVSHAYAVLRLEDGPDMNYNLNLLDTGNGRVIWNIHHRNRPVIKTEMQKNWILLQMDDEVTVLKFFSL